MAARRELYAGVMSGTSLDGVDAVIAEFAVSSGSAFVHAGRDAYHFPIGAARRIAGAAVGRQRRNRAGSARGQRTGRSLCESDRRRLRCVRRGASRPGGGRRPRPDGAAPAGAGLDAADQQSRTRRRARLRYRRGRLQEPRRRGRRPGCAAGAGVSRGIVPGPGRFIASSSTSAASPMSPTCRRAELSAASTPGRETC